MAELIKARGRLIIFATATVRRACQKYFEIFRR